MNNVQLPIHSHARSEQHSGPSHNKSSIFGLYMTLVSQVLWTLTPKDTHYHRGRGKKKKDYSSYKINTKEANFFPPVKGCMLAAGGRGETRPVRSKAKINASMAISFIYFFFLLYEKELRGNMERIERDTDCRRDRRGYRRKGEKIQKGV